MSESFEFPKFTASDIKMLESERAFAISRMEAAAEAEENRNDKLLAQIAAIQTTVRCAFKHSPELRGNEEFLLSIAKMLRVLVKGVKVMFDINQPAINPYMHLLYIDGIDFSIYFDTVDAILRKEELRFRRVFNE